MATTLQTKLGAIINSIYLVCVISFVIALAYVHVQLITHEYPLDYNEGGMLVTTQTIMEWANPYSLESQPSRISLYPVFYNILVAPLASIFGNTFELHRAISGLFILASCALCFYFCRRESVARSESFIAALLLYAALLFYSTPVASPNALGLLLFLAAIIIPWVHGFSARSLCVTIVLGILAFYTKQYFVACLGYVALYVFLTVSKKRAIYFGVAALSTFIAALVVVFYTSPYYLEDTLFAVQSSAKLATADEMVIKQLKEFVQIYLPVLVIFSVAVIYKIGFTARSSTQSMPGSRKESLVDILSFNKPLLQHKPNYSWFCCVCSLIIFVLVLGKNRGNHMTYLFQLVSPFFLIGVFALSSGMPKWRWPFRVLVLFALYKGYAMLPSDFSVEEASWIKLREEVSQAGDVYGSTLVLQEIIEKGAPIYLSGGSRYFLFGTFKPSFLVKSKPEHTIPEVWERYVKLIQTKIKKQEFDLLVIDHWMRLPTSKPSLTLIQTAESETLALLKVHYTETDTMMLPLADRLGGGKFRVHLWKPKTDGPEIEN